MHKLLLTLAGYASPHHGLSSAPGPVAPLQQQLEHASQKAGFVDEKYKPRQQVCLTVLSQSHIFPLISKSSCSKVYMIADTWYCFLQFTTSERIEPIFDLKVCGFSLTLKGMMWFLLFIWYLTSLMSLYLFIIDVWRVQDKQKSCRWIVMKFSGPFHFGPSPIPKQFDRGHTFLSP